MPMTATALILAAGYSSRMGAFKPLLPLAGISALDRAVGLFRDAGVEDVRVVTGHRAAELELRLERLRVRTVLNPDYPQGMFSSVAAGVASLEREVEACFVLPVDLPLVRSASVARLLQAYGETPAAVLYPTFLGERGHPPLIDGEVARRLPGWSGTEGLQGALGEWEKEAREVAVADELILRDMDHRDDFQRLQRRAERLGIPSSAESRALLEMSYDPQDPVVRHSRAVAELAVQLGRALNAAGGDLDLELLEAAGLLHDVARREPEHAEAGAERLRTLGFGAVAEVVATHMDLPAPGRIGAAEIVFLADKLVQEDRRVSLEERFGAVEEHFRHDPEVRRKIGGRLQTARLIQARMEGLLGCDLTEMVATQ
jgi:molybdenum cofactor cytidylyltransferase